MKANLPYVSVGLRAEIYSFTAHRNEKRVSDNIWRADTLHTAHVTAFALDDELAEGSDFDG